MWGNVTWIEALVVAISLFGGWYAIRHYLLVHGDKAYVIASGRNGIRLALVNKDTRTARERCAKVGLCLLAGVVSMLTPEPIRPEVSVLQWVLGFCFIGILLLLVYGTRQDVKDRERIFERIIRSRKEAEQPVIDDPDTVVVDVVEPIPVVVVQDEPVVVEVVEKPPEKEKP